MSLEEIFAQAILTGGVTILNCSVVIGSNAQVSDFLQNTAASTPNLKVDQEIKVDPRLKTEKAALIWKTLTEKSIFIQRALGMYGIVRRLSMDIWCISYPIFWE